MTNHIPLKTPLKPMLLVKLALRLPFYIILSFVSFALISESTSKTLQENDFNTDQTGLFFPLQNIPVFPCSPFQSDYSPLTQPSSYKSNSTTSSSRSSSSSFSPQQSPASQVYSSIDNDDDHDGWGSFHQLPEITVPYPEAVLIWDYQLRHPLKKNEAKGNYETLPMGTMLYVIELCPEMLDVSYDNTFYKSMSSPKGNRWIAHCIKKEDLLWRFELSQDDYMAIPVSLIHFYNEEALEKLVDEMMEQKRETHESSPLSEKSQTTRKRMYATEIMQIKGRNCRIGEHSVHGEKESRHFQRCQCRSIFKNLFDCRPVLQVNPKNPFIFKPTPWMIREYNCIQLINNTEQTEQGKSLFSSAEDNFVYVIELFTHIFTGWSFIIQIIWSDKSGTDNKVLAHGWLPTEMLHFDHNKDMLAKHFVDSEEKLHKADDYMTPDCEEFVNIPLSRTMKKPFSKVMLMKSITMHGGALSVNKLLMPLSASSTYWVLVEPQVSKNGDKSADTTIVAGAIRQNDKIKSIFYDMSSLCWMQCSLANTCLDSDLKYHWASLEVPEPGSWGYAPSTFFFSRLHIGKLIETPMALSELMQSAVPHSNHFSTNIDMTGLQHLLMTIPSNSLPYDNLLHQSPIVYESTSSIFQKASKKTDAIMRWKLMDFYNPLVDAHCVELVSDPSLSTARGIKIPFKRANIILKKVNQRTNSKSKKNFKGDKDEERAISIGSTVLVKTPASSLNYQRMKQALFDLDASTRHYQLSTITDVSTERFDNGGNGFLCKASAHFGTQKQMLFKSCIAVKFIHIKKFKLIENEAVGLSVVAAYNQRRLLKEKNAKRRIKPSLKQILDTSCAPFPSIYGYFLVRIKEKSFMEKKGNENTKQKGQLSKESKLNFKIVNSENWDKWFMESKNYIDKNEKEKEDMVNEGEIYVGFCMEFIDGMPLFNFLSTSKNSYEGKFPVTHLQPVVRQLFEALYIMSEKLHLSHRDIKPKNIYIRRKNTSSAVFEQEVIIIDYGNCCVRKKCRKRCRLGTTTLYAHPASLAPRATWQKCDPRNDIRGVAMVIFELVLARHIFLYKASMSEQTCIDLVCRYPKTPANYKFPLCLDQMMQFIVKDKDSKKQISRRHSTESSLKNSVTVTTLEANYPPVSMPTLLADLLGRIFVAKYEEMPDLKNLLKHPYITENSYFEDN